jgi:hypothetical protein
LAAGTQKKLEHCLSGFPARTRFRTTRPGESVCMAKRQWSGVHGTGE